MTHPAIKAAESAVLADAPAIMMAIPREKRERMVKDAVLAALRDPSVRSRYGEVGLEDWHYLIDALDAEIEAHK